MILNAVFPSCLVAIGLLLLAGCATAPPASDKQGASEPGEAAASAMDQTRDGLADAALSPLEDLNLKRDAIPEPIKELKSAYLDARQMSCAEIAASVLILDEHLGADWDTPDDAEIDETRAQWAADKTADATLDAVSSEARGLIPFRGLVREATGAEAHARRVRTAFRKASERRAFLKGVGQARGCLPPAAPWLLDGEGDDTIIYRDHVGEG